MRDSSRQISFEDRAGLKCKTGSLAAPRFAHSICPSDAEKHRRQHAPQERCVNGVKILGPVESYLPPCASYFNFASTSPGNRMQEKNSRNRPLFEFESWSCRVCVPRASSRLFSLVLAAQPILAVLIRAPSPQRQPTKTELKITSGAPYFRKSPSRNWSRPTNVFDERNFPKRSRISRFRKTRACTASVGAGSNSTDCASTTR